MLRCALQMVSSETITAGHPMQAAPPHRCRVATSPRSPPMSAQPQTSQGPNLGMTVTTFENPMGIDGFEFVEFAAPEGQGEAMHDYFARMGFTAVLRHKSRPITVRSEEHTSELQSLMRISSAVFCLKKKTPHHTP